MSTHSQPAPLQPDPYTSVRPVFSRLTLSLTQQMDTTKPTETEDRWYKHAELVICSLFCAEEEEHYDSWSERVLECEWNDNSYGYSIDLVISKMRVVVETNEKKTPAVHRIRYMVWLGLLTSCLLEAEVCILLHRQYTTNVADVFIGSQVAGFSGVPAVSMPGRPC